MLPFFKSNYSNPSFLHVNTTYIKELNELVKEQLQNSLMLEYDQSKSIFKSKLPAKFLERKRSLFLIIIGNNINDVDELFRQTKIGSDSTIDKIMRLQIKGVKFSVNSQQTIDYVQNIKQITIEINSSGEFYEDMKDDKSICVDVGSFKNQNLRLRLLSIL